MQVLRNTCILPLAVAAENHRLFAHRRHKVVSRRGHLALVAYEQPTAGKDLLLFLLVDGMVDEHFAANRPLGEVNQVARCGVSVANGHVVRLLAAWAPVVRILTMRL